MKNLSLSLLMLATLALTASCNKDSNDNDNSNTNPKIPDTFFEVTVTGDMSHNFTITIPASTPQTTFAITGSHSGAANLLLLNFKEIPTGWGLGLNVTCTDLIEDTFNSNQTPADICAFYSTGANTFNYQSTAVSVTLTKVAFFASAANIDNYYVDGNFSGTMADPADPSKTINITGSFKGVFVPST